jgi:integrase
MAALGVGPGEYLTLQCEDLHPDDLEVHVRGTKNQHRDRYVAVDARLWGWIDRAVPAPLHERWLGVYWRRACQAAEVVGVRMYDLRHLSAQLAGDRGVTDRDLTVHLGHSNPGMSHRYSRRRTARLVAAAVAEGLLEGRSA